MRPDPVFSERVLWLTSIVPTELAVAGGVASIERAANANWSVDASVARLKRLHYVLKRLHECFTAVSRASRFTN